MLIESLVVLRVKLPSGEVVLKPGCPVQFSEDEGRKLLEKAPGKVRAVAPAPIVLEPASPTARPIYWERSGSIIGPATPEVLAKAGDGPTTTFWVVALHEGAPTWINSTMLRSKGQFEAQNLPKPKGEKVVEALPVSAQIRLALEDGMPRSAKQIAKETKLPLATVEDALWEYRKTKWHRLILGDGGPDTLWTVLTPCR